MSNIMFTLQPPNMPYHSYWNWKKQSVTFCFLLSEQFYGSRNNFTHWNNLLKKSSEFLWWLLIKCATLNTQRQERQNECLWAGRPKGITKLLLQIRQPGWPLIAAVWTGVFSHDCMQNCHWPILLVTTFTVEIWALLYAFLVTQVLFKSLETGIKHGLLIL